MPGRLAKTLAVFVAAGAACGLAGCANPAGQAGAPAVTVSVADSLPQLITANRLQVPASYGGFTAEFAPPPATAKLTMTSQQAIDFYTKTNQSPEALGQFDYMLATLVRPTGPNVTDGELVWVFINHNQHNIGPAPAGADSAMAQVKAQNQDTVTVIDAASGRWLWQEKGNTLQPAKG